MVQGSGLWLRARGSGLWLKVQGSGLDGDGVPPRREQARRALPGGVRASELERVPESARVSDCKLE